MHNQQQGGLRSWLDRRRFDVVGAVVGLVLAALLFPLRFLSSQIYIQTLPIVLGVASGLYLLAVRQSRGESGVPRVGPIFARIGPALVFLCLAAMVLVAGLSGERSLHFYDLGGVVGALLFAQVVFLRERDLAPSVILVQVLVFGLVIRFSGLYTAPGFIGIDVWSHVTYAQAIEQENSLAAISESKYFASPLYHLLAVAAARLLDLSLRNGLYLTLGIAVPSVVLLVYGAATMLVSVRWALFAAVAYVVSDHAIRWGIHLIPTSMGLVFFLGVLFGITRILQRNHQPSDYGLLLFFSAATILTHQISSFIMLVVVGSGVLAQLLLKLDVLSSPTASGHHLREVSKPGNLLGPMVFDLGLITFMWSLTPYQGDTFLETVLNYLYVTLFTSAGFLNGVTSDSAGGAAAGGGGGQTAQFIAEVATYVDTLGFLLLLFTTVLGSFAVLRRTRANHATFTLLISVVVMLFFVLGLPLFNIDNFVPGRWFAFLYAPMALLTAVGLRHLSRNVSPRVVVVCLVVFMVLFPSVMLMSSDGTPDSPVFPSQNERLSYTETELTGVQTIGDITAGRNDTLYTDHPYQTVFIRTDTHEAAPIRLRNGRAVLQGPTVYREYQSDGGSFFRIGEGAAIRNPPRANVCPPTTNHVYANGDVRMCIPPTTAG
jgi:uncharacterized membrane protein